MLPDKEFDASMLLGCEEFDARNILTDLGSFVVGVGVLEGRMFSDCLYLSCKSLGVSVRLTPANNGKVDAVFLYNHGMHGFKHFEPASQHEAMLQ